MPITLWMVFIVAIGMPIRRTLSFNPYRHVVYSRIQAKMQGYVHPAHPPETEINDNLRPYVSPLCNKKHDRELLFMYSPFMDNNDLSFRDMVVITYGNIETLNAFIPSGNTDIPLSVRRGSRGSDHKAHEKSRNYDRNIF